MKETAKAGKKIKDSMKQVIILERDATTASVRFRFALWAAVPATRQTMFANAGATSAFKNISAPELAAIQAGQVVEKVDWISFEAGATIQTVQTQLQAAWTAYQAEINNINPWNRYGTFWDGTTWTAGGLT